MKFMRNPEIQRECVISVIFTVAAAVCAVITVGNAAGMLVLFLCVLAGIMHFLSAWCRYRDIARMSQNLDEILYDEKTAFLQDCEEGELAVLHTQLGKLVRRLREQNGNLQKDKIFLADSLADVSHQIKTPLTSIHLLLSSLDKEESAQRRHEISREIAGLLERIDWLVYALLKMSRLDAGVAEMKTDAVLVQELADKAYELVAVPMDIRGIQWKTQVAEGSTFVGDLSWSVEAIGNILKNCMEHTPENRCIYFVASENAIYTEIRIEDEGTGIAAEDLPHLFERFYRGKGNDSQSVGIGLSLAQKIILQQNGTIQVKNREQGGAVFCIRFYKTIV